MNWKRFGKAAVGVLGVLAGALNYALPVVPDKWKPLATAALGLLAAYGIYQVPYVAAASAVKAKA